MHTTYIPQQPSLNLNKVTGHTISAFFHLSKFISLELLHLKYNALPLDGISTLSKALCCWVRGLVCTNELESYASGSVAAGSATHAGQVSRQMPD
jgi:Ran GTPase-activating protein (RanGAP) involved in mRNA processing and transport